MRDMDASAPKLRLAQFPADLDELAVMNIDYLTEATGRLLDEFEVVMTVPDVEESRATVLKFAQPGALFLVAEDEGRLVGMGALRTLEPGVVEVKRMFLRPDYRAQGLGSALMDGLLAEARDTLSAETIRLDSCRFMIEAQRLYRSRGFAERDPYPGTEIPEPLQKFWRFYENASPRQLTRPTTRSAQD